MSGTEVELQEDLSVVFKDILKYKGQMQQWRLCNMDTSFLSSDYVLLLHYNG